MSDSWSAPSAHPFLNRESIMSEMAAWVERCRAEGTPCRIYVHGIEGLGVSCLVTQFVKVHRAAIDGPMIWLTGRGPDGRSIPLGELLSRALRQLDVLPADQPATDPEKVDVYRTIARDRRFALVVDDCDNVGQLRDLTPDDAAGVVVIATTPFRRPWLESAGFKAFTPDVLAPEAARALFRALTAAGGDQLDDSTVDGLVRACGGFPLLVRVVAAQIRLNPARGPRLLKQLRAAKVTPLHLDPEQRMMRFLDATYENLGAEQKRAYRLLGSLPAADFCVEAAAAALGIDSDEAFLLLEHLLEWNLTVATGYERYAFHPVLRADARTRCTGENAAESWNTVSRWTTWCLQAALPRGVALSNRWMVAPVTDALSALGHTGYHSPRDALEWFGTEYANLIAAIRAAHQNGLHNSRSHTTAWQLCVVIWKYLHLNGLYDTWIDSHEAGLDSARAVSSAPGVLQLTSQLGAAYLEIGEYDAAERCFEESLSAASDLNHLLGVQSAHEWLGKTAARRGRWHFALRYFAESWAATLAADDTAIPPAQRERIRALLHLQSARVYLELRQYDRAIEEAGHGAAIFHATTNESENHAKCLLVLGRARLAEDNAAAAIRAYQQALQEFERTAVRRWQAHAQSWLGRALLAAGQREQAEVRFRSALGYYREVGNPLALDIAAELEQLRPE
ncbi:tetratricopeptide repeat protein [Nocardia sp. 2]|uniref:Tetratricopeptide repeat protein n=1 Tax=Nocardia acididurans TaxID=2802282 RepID=A0ABS1MJ09_9NOCA|nr:tetratricopeptide repeat protein [Nocardia acididurans]MBL1080035.1 tetratricopeptide repeat protein [Nocardia acididurans]